MLFADIIENGGPPGLVGSIDLERVCCRCHFGISEVHDFRDLTIKGTGVCAHTV